MLGRQQIAGIPTAISELFKNAHDAYADHVTADFYRSKRLFVVQDDGVGMTYDQFSNNWLTLATDVKVNQPNDLLSILGPQGKPKRQTLGEKGIGRLAIASIGPQVLVLTRSNDNDDGILAAFVNWDLFALPNIDLHEINIPIRMFPIGQVPTKKDIDALVDAVSSSLTAFRSRVDSLILDRIRQTLNQFDIDEDLLLDSAVNNLCQPGRHGTQFWIQPVDETLELDIAGNPNDDVAPPLIKMLIGFTNTMTPGSNMPVIKTAFRDHLPNGNVNDLIDVDSFFTPEEFETADHILQGRFDGYGQFDGTVKIYGREPVNYVIPWRPARGRRTQCGPFDLKVAVVQGEARNSLLPPEEYALINTKMITLGGLYIYKDGIRVLPYGNNDYDFLDIEKKRSKSAYYYYYSYRKIFGTVEIDQITNAELVEKAGREGFRENRAYRQFRDILMNFFNHTAADFFRQDGVHVSVFEEQRSELERLERVKRRRATQVTARRREFEEQLDDFFRRVGDANPQNEIKEKLEELKDDIRKIDHLDDPEEFSTSLLNAERRARHEVKDIRDDLHIARPRGVGLSKRVRSNWDAYRTQILELNANAFAPAEREIDEIVRQRAGKAKFLIDQRRRLETAIEESVQNIRQRTRREATDTHVVGRDVTEQVVELTRQVMINVEDTIRQVLTDVARLDLGDKNDSDLIEVRAAYEETLEQSTDEGLAVLANTKAHLQAIDWGRASEGDIITQLDILEATESELLDARDRADLDFEMVQLGVAINVINHEFDASIRQVRSSLRRLKAWADLNPSLQGLHDEIRTSFEHLDGYLTLFTPLQRRLYRNEVEIRGSDIVAFLANLFRERLRRHDVVIDSTVEFDQHKLTSFPSTFYPVFVNLVDNSLFWLRDEPNPRRILLDMIDGDMIVSDSGPGVQLQDHESAFESGFTRKPLGRGLGLYIARESLRRVRYSISLQPKGPLKGACFRIQKNDKD